MIEVDWIVELQQKIKAFDFSSEKSNQLMGYQRASAEDARKLNPPPKESAVMMLLFRRTNQWHTLFILRPDGTGIHSNQLSFPGGKLEAAESNLEAALRETHEEVGISKDQIRIIGRLSSLYIPPSHFVVQPFIGVINEEPHFQANPHEVVQLIEFPIATFLQEPIILEKEIFIPTFNRTIRAKYFDVNGFTLWGATAMMIQEFRTIIGFYH